MVNDLDYADIKFSVSKKDYSKIELKTKIWNNVFCYENDLVYPVHASDKKIENCMDLLLITDDNRLHYVYIKYCDRFMSINQKTRIKNSLADIAYNVLVIKKSCKNIKMFI